MTRTQAVASAIGLFAVWMLMTYLLEARLGTFSQPDTASRFVYTVVANVLIGTIGAALVIRALVRRAEFRESQHTALRDRAGFSSSSPWRLFSRDFFCLPRVSQPRILCHPGECFRPGARRLDRRGRRLLGLVRCRSPQRPWAGLCLRRHCRRFRCARVWGLSLRPQSSVQYPVYGVVAVGSWRSNRALLLSRRRPVQHHCFAQRVRDPRRDPGSWRKWESRPICQSAAPADRDGDRGCRCPGHR